MTKVRTTINPHEVIDVDDAELSMLTYGGIIDSREGDEGWIDDEQAVPVVEHEVGDATPEGDVVEQTDTEQAPPGVGDEQASGINVPKTTKSRKG